MGIVMVDFEPEKLIKNIEERVIVNERIGDFKYTTLTAIEVMHLSQLLKDGDDNDAFMFKLAYMMFAKSYPNITYEQFLNMGIDGAEIARLIINDVDFRVSSSDKQ